MRPSYDDIRRLVERARAGDTSARHSLVEAHIGLAINAASISNDDALLANLLGSLVECVSEFLVTGRSPATLSAFLKQALRKDAIDFIRDDKRHAIRITKVPAKEMWERDDCYEMLDEIVACCETPLEEQMVHLRNSGLTHAQVAEKLDTVPSVVHGAIKRLELRYSLKKKVRCA